MTTPIALRRPEPEKPDLLGDLTKKFLGAEDVKDKRWFSKRFIVSCDAMVCASFYGLDGLSYTVTKVACGPCGEIFVPYPCGNPWVINLEGCSRLFTKQGWYEIREEKGAALPEEFYLEQQPVTPAWAMALLAEGVNT